MEKVRDEDALVCMVTCPNDEVAHDVARTLVRERLAACVNVIAGVRSIYRWKDGISDDTEALCLVKTTREHYVAMRDRVVEMHPYEVPEVVTLEVGEGHGPYLEWLRGSVGRLPPMGGAAK